jgi:diaminopimelate epimerase
MGMELTRMSAAGNAFYLAIDPGLSPAMGRALARPICAGWEGNPPADGLIIAGSDPPGQIMYNPDGSEGMCANGLRCLARLLVDRGKLGRAGEIRTMDGPKGVGVTGGEVAVSLGPARDLPERPGSRESGFAVSVAGEDLKGFGVFVGNPHFVVFGDAVLQGRLPELGPLLESHDAFPDRVNVEFALREPGGIRVRVWERGAGETPSCGTGAAAVASAGPEGIRVGETRRLVYPGGVLTVSLDASGALSLAGPVVGEGSLTIDLNELPQSGETEEIHD